MNLNLTLIVQMLFFAVFVWFSKKYVWAPLMGALEERRTQIADGLAAAEKGQEAQGIAELEAADLIKQAKTQASEIIANAEKRGNAVVEEAKDTATSEKDRIVASAQADVEQEVHSAREALRGQVSSIAIAAASKVVGKEIDENAHADLINDLVQQMQTN